MSCHLLPNPSPSSYDMLFFSPVLGFNRENGMVNHYLEGFKQVVIDPDQRERAWRMASEEEGIGVA